MIEDIQEFVEENKTFYDLWDNLLYKQILHMSHQNQIEPKTIAQLFNQMIDENE